MILTLIDHYMNVSMGIFLKLYATNIFMNVITYEYLEERKEGGEKDRYDNLDEEE